MMQPDDPIGGIWAVRPVGADRRKAEREGEEGKGSGNRRRRSGRDTVTLSREARQLSRAEKDELHSQEVSVQPAAGAPASGGDQEKDG